MAGITNLLKKLLIIRSETSHEQKLSNYLKDYCKSLGFDKVIQDKNHNIIAIIDAGNGNIINFNAHMDTKLRGPKVKVEHGKIFGRGAADMKGSIACMLDSASELIINKSKFSGKVIFTFVVCEESGILSERKKGTYSVINYLLSQNLKPTAVIIGESSQIFEKDTYGIIVGQRGRYTCKIQISGEAAHGGFGANLGINASVIASKIKLELFKYSKKLRLDSLNITDGENLDPSYNNVPSDSIILIDIRFSSKDNLDNIKENIGKINKKNILELKNITGKGSYKIIDENILYYPIDCRNAPLLEIAEQSFLNVLRKRPKINWSMFGTDASFYAKSRIFAKPNILIIGPGSQDKAHKVDEYVKQEHIKNYSKIYTEIVNEYLKK